MGIPPQKVSPLFGKPDSNARCRPAFGVFGEDIEKSLVTGFWSLVFGKTLAGAGGIWYSDRVRQVNPNKE
jgi:hypothetical protein